MNIKRATWIEFRNTLLETWHEYHTNWFQFGSDETQITSQNLMKYLGSQYYSQCTRDKRTCSSCLISFQTYYMHYMLLNPYCSCSSFEQSISFRPIQVDNNLTIWDSIGKYCNFLRSILIVSKWVYRLCSYIY